MRDIQSPRRDLSAENNAAAEIEHLRTALTAVYAELTQLRKHAERRGWHDTVFAQRVEAALRILDRALKS